MSQQDQKWGTASHSASPSLPPFQLASDPEGATGKSFQLRVFRFPRYVFAVTIIMNGTTRRPRISSGMSCERPPWLGGRAGEGRRLSHVLLFIECPPTVLTFLSLRCLRVAVTDGSIGHGSAVLPYVWSFVGHSTTRGYYYCCRLRQVRNGNNSHVTGPRSRSWIGKREIAVGSHVMVRRGLCNRFESVVAFLSKLWTCKR